MKGIHIFIGTVVGAVLAVIVTGFFVVGSPTNERIRKLDQQRVNDLQQISSAIDQYYNINARYTFPETLEKLREERNVYVSSIADPETKVPYEYREISATSYELCAVFASDGMTENANDQVARPVYDPYSKFWTHSAGRACFTLEVVKNPIMIPAVPVPVKM